MQPHEGYVALCDKCTRAVVHHVASLGSHQSDWAPGVQRLRLQWELGSGVRCIGVRTSVSVRCSSVSIHRTSHMSVCHKLRLNSVYTLRGTDEVTAGASVSISAMVRIQVSEEQRWRLITNRAFCPERVLWAVCQHATAPG